MNYITYRKNYNTNRVTDCVLCSVPVGKTDTLSVPFHKLVSLHFLSKNDIK